MSIEFGKRVRTVRARLQLTQEQVAERLGIPRSAISEIESGKRQVTASELVDLAGLFGEPVEALLGLGEEHAGDEAVMFRADGLPSMAQAQLQGWVRWCETYQWLEDSLGERPAGGLRPVMAVFSTFAQAADLAEQERARLELGETPAHGLLAALEERVGVKVLFLDLEESVSGASINSTRFGPAIVVNRRHRPGRRVFTLAHELFHLLVRGPVVRAGVPRGWHVCDGQSLGQKKDLVEQLADSFAGRLLMPAEHFIERLRQTVSESGAASPVDLICLARYFGVSVQAVFVQLGVLRLAPWDVAMGAYRDPVFQEQIERAGPERASEPERFRRLAIKACLAEKISRGRLAELLEMNVADVDDVLQRYGAGGTDRGISLTLPR